MIIKSGAQEVRTARVEHQLPVHWFRQGMRPPQPPPLLPPAHRRRRHRGHTVGRPRLHNRGNHLRRKGYGRNRPAVPANRASEVLQRGDDRRCRLQVLAIWRLLRTRLRHVGRVPGVCRPLAHRGQPGNIRNAQQCQSRVSGNFIIHAQYNSYRLSLYVFDVYFRIKYVAWK